MRISSPIIDRDRGFTLVELLIVIVILGVLSSVSVFAVRGISSRGEAAACQADVKTLETAIEVWRVNHPGTDTVSEIDLVQAGHLRSPSTRYDLIDSWRDQATTRYDEMVKLGAGEHAVVVEFYENGGEATARVSYAPA